MRYQVEERVQCARSGKVKYSYREDFILPLPIPLEAAINKGQLQCRMLSCLSSGSSLFTFCAVMLHSQGGSKPGLSSGSSLFTFCAVMLHSQGGSKPGLGIDVLSR